MARAAAVMVGAGVLLLLLAPRDHVPWAARANAQDPVPDAGTAPPADTNRAALTRAVQRFVDPNSDADVCRPIDPVRGEQRFECRVTECPGGCQVVQVVTVLGLRRGRYRRVSQERVRRGDTGACGCCTLRF